MGSPAGWEGSVVPQAGREEGYWSLLSLFFFFSFLPWGGMLLKGGENSHPKCLLAVGSVPFLTPSACWGASLAPASVVGSLEPQEWGARGPDV